MSQKHSTEVVDDNEMGFTDSLSGELEEGEVVQETELICVNEEDLEQLAMEENEDDIEFSTPDNFKIRRRGQDLIKYHVVSCQEELEELRKQNALEDAMLDPKDKLHLVKYVKIDGKIVKLWECGICAKDFRHQYTLMRHLPTHTDERKFVCDICNKAFRQMSTLSQHRAIHSDARPYVCETCQKRFNRVSTLISHRRTHTEEKPHKCHVCGKGFHQKGNLKNHVFSHTNERPYRCEVCGRGFNQMSNLVVHKIKAHGQTGHAKRLAVPPGTKFVCQICGQKFQKRIHLVTHEETKHSIVTKSNSRKMRSVSLSSEKVAIDVSDEDATVLSSIVEDGKNNGKIKFRHAQAHSPSNENHATSGLLIDAIDTKGMQQARSSNRNAFALLKAIDGTPSLVKIFDLPNDKQLLIPATAEDIAAMKIATDEAPFKSNPVNVSVVATVTQHMDEQNQLVVHIEPNEPEHELLGTFETLADDSQAELGVQSHVNGTGTINNIINMYWNNNCFETGNEQIQFVRPLPDGGFEIVSEEQAANLLEDTTNEIQPDENNLSELLSDEETARIIISQDEDGQLLVEGTTLQFILGSNSQQQLQLLFSDQTEKSFSVACTESFKDTINNSHSSSCSWFLKYSKSSSQPPMLLGLGNFESKL